MGADSARLFFFKVMEEVTSVRAPDPNSEERGRNRWDSLQTVEEMTPFSNSTLQFEVEFSNGIDWISC